ncbi:MAG: ATP-dependent zinc metalloprotease FtsH [Acidimicrobiia bacterium]|nr:ATP-dependent zinc metalloprotease FtsH [Acidimicrobiia bacterium]
MSNNPPTPQKPTKPSNEKQKSSKLPKPPTSKKPSLWAWVAIATFAIILISTSSSLLNSKDIKSIKYSGSKESFKTLVKNGKIKSAIYEPASGNIEGDLKTKIDKYTKYKTDGPLQDISERDLKLIEDAKVKFSYKKVSSNFLADWMPFIIMSAILIGLFLFVSKRAGGQMGSVMNVGRSKAKIYNSENPKTTFKDVAGYGPVKQEISEVVDFLKNPSKFKDIGARIPRGVLLVGPPGTGKTLIARAVAGEAGVPFISVTGSDFMEMFVGVGAARVRDLFEMARKSAPAIIFVDEIDSIGRKRGAGVGGGHDEREQTLNQMLAEMDGFETSEGIVMMAATNRPDILDAALLRPGRFDRQIVVPLPTQDERLEILKVHFIGKKIADDVNIDTLSRATPGMSGADLSNLVNEAALHAVRRGQNEVHYQDFNSAIDRVLMGLRRPSVLMNEHEKKLTAYHEGGHAMLAYLSKNADPVHKVTILPTGMALGMTQQLPLEERYSYNKNYLLDQLMVMLAGRGAELTVFDNQSTGASNDLERATDIAQSMVKEWGMSDKIGPMAWGSSSSIFLGDEMMSSKKYSDDTAKLIDDEASLILKESEVRTHKVLKEFRKGLDAIAGALVEKEEISGEEVGQLVDEAMGRECANSITSIDVDTTN